MTTAMDIYNTLQGESTSGDEETTAEMVENDYIPAWSYITIVEKNIDTQTMLVQYFPMF